MLTRCKNPPGFKPSGFFWLWVLAMPKRQMKTYQTAEYNAILYIPITIFYIYIPNNLPFVPFLFPLILLCHCLLRQ